jgi:hypothetical protein
MIPFPLNKGEFLVFIWMHSQTLVIFQLKSMVQLTIIFHSIDTSVGGQAENNVHSIAESCTGTHYVNRAFYLENSSLEEEILNLMAKICEKVYVGGSNFIYYNFEMIGSWTFTSPPHALT